MVFRKKLSRKQMLELLGNFPTCTVVMGVCKRTLAGPAIDGFRSSGQTDLPNS
jgi:hypothetical protein